MDALLSKVTQQAMNHAIRCGITITSGYAIRQCSRLIRNAKENDVETGEISQLQQRLEAKIRIISPAIDMIELIAARGNTSLESAVTLTKQIRWEIQALGVRLATAAADEEKHRRAASSSKTKLQNQHELRLIISDMKRLLERIEDAVPLINLAITTSGVNLSTTLPSSVSPSRLLQASTFLTAGDSRYATSPGQPVQVGPAFTLSLYMLFSAHAYRPHDEDATRETTWKEVMHKARVKLLRVPLNSVYTVIGDQNSQIALLDRKSGVANGEDTENVPSQGQAFEFTYQLQIIEDLDDDRVHTYDDDEVQPSSLDDVALAGIREALPVHEISKIFYADTGKILNIGTDGEINNPVLLLKRDVNAVPPRRMMGEARDDSWFQSDGYPSSDDEIGVSHSARKHSTHLAKERAAESLATGSVESMRKIMPWSLPPNLDPEWIAFEVYNEHLDSDDDDELGADSLSTDSSKPPPPMQEPSLDQPDLPIARSLSNLHLSKTTPASSPSPMPATQMAKQGKADTLANIHPLPTAPTSLPALRTSLSLLELLIRLTALQQFQQMSHLAINDELLNFFLNEAGTTGAGGDAETRQRVRREARERVGFDPYDESPVKRRGEEYLEHHTGGDRYEETEASSRHRTTPRSARHSPLFANQYRSSLSGASARFPLHAAQQATSHEPDSPSMSSPLARKMGAENEVYDRAAISQRMRSPLIKSETDSTLGTSPDDGPGR